MQPEEPQSDWQPPIAPPTAGVKSVPEQQLPGSQSAEEPTIDINQYAQSQPHLVVEPREGDDEVVLWQATEHVQRDKSAVWYIIFGIVAVVMIILAIFVIKSTTFAVLVVVMAVALVVYTIRPPAILNYTLSRKGLHINDKLYHFEDFKVFGLVQDDAENSIMLVPRKRFQPGVSIYFPDDAGEAVVDLLAARLPMQEVKLDPVDRLIRLLRI